MLSSCSTRSEKQRDLTNEAQPMKGRALGRTDAPSAGIILLLTWKLKLQEKQKKILD